MAVPLQDTTGTPLPVTWIREDQAAPLILCSQLGETVNWARRP
jgi:hypothetical protein